MRTVRQAGRVSSASASCWICPIETAEEWHRRQAVVLLPNGLKESFLETNRSQVLRMMHAHIRKLEADANVALGDALPSRKVMLDHAFCVDGLVRSRVDVLKDVESGD